MSLFIPEILKAKVKEWKDSGYECEYPAISEILKYNYLNDEVKLPRFLRTAQIEALETYWYLRIKENTPHIKELYEKLILDPSDLLKSLGIKLNQEDLTRLLLKGGSLDTIFDKIKSDDNFVRKHNLESVKETLTLNYPSYILALAMGSGKTLLIGTIIATEFCLSLEYPKENFVKNALVFAPGKTILGALKQISDIPFAKILPPKYYNLFLSSVKIKYTEDGQKELTVIEKSLYNIIVTNTEKIRIQKSTRKHKITLLNFKEKKKTEQEEETVNLRLQTIASLPDLAIFSDEGHHTYGQSLDSELKKVRKTVDYLAENTNVLCVINTTGTPYYKKQMLKDVVYWYGLSQGIRDGILKEVRDNIESFHDIKSEDFISKIVTDFFTNYKNVTIYDGAKAKLAIYFPQTNDVEQAKPIVEDTLIKIGIDPSTILVVHNKSEDDVKDLFNNRINEITNPYRVYLLVNMGTEGWNCPSLFATALARKLTTSNNFILQAASRCLRQTQGNRIRAKIYISYENVLALDNQLRETYDETLSSLEKAKQEIIRDRIVIRKSNIPPIILKKKIKRIIERKGKKYAFRLELPTIKRSSGKKITYKIKKIPESKKLLQETNKIDIKKTELLRDIYDVAIEISSIFRLNTFEVYDNLLEIYPKRDVPENHVTEIMNQIETQIQKWEIIEEEVEFALMIIKLDGFTASKDNGNKIYVTEIMYRKEREHYFLHFNSIEALNQHNFGFHYSPYNFDSNPEKNFLVRMLESLNEEPGDVEDIFFTGGLSSASQTDILFEYKDDLGIWRNYTPDFIIKKKNGKILVIEVKKERSRNDSIEGEKGLKAMALHEIENLNEDRIKYKMLFTNSEEIGFDNIKTTTEWIYGETKK